MSKPRILALVFFVMASLVPTLGHTAPVEFSFRPPAMEGNPFVREIWARVESPDESRLLLPAFYVGNNQWSVRTRATAKGNYRFLEASEILDGRSVPLRVELQGRDRIRPRDLDPMTGTVLIDPRSGRDFVDEMGTLYVPLGGALPWATDSPESYYPKAFADLTSAGLNWSRIWMCHWGQLNLDWVESHHGDQPAIGELSLDVARRWDRVIELAETHGIRLQVVLQHHGQYSTSKDSNWKENPWNTQLGGFLEKPEDFFTNEQARQLTRDKLRYIAARWGYSSAILSWELFNEVMWTNSRRGDAQANQAVAKWHTEMARHLRRYDVQQHLVTTSDDDLHHPLWSAMDYYQPHLYGANMVLGVQSLELDPSEIDRPIFYGEIGDDNMASLTDEQRTSGAVLPTLAWSGLFGQPTQPAQLWNLETLRQNNRWPEVRSLSGFARASGIARQLLPEVAQLTVIGGDVAPVVIEPGYYWHQGPDPTITVPLDGRLTPSLMAFRRILTDASAIPAHPFPSKMTLLLDNPAASTASLLVSRVGNHGGSLRVTLNGKWIVDEQWPAAAPQRPTPSNLKFPFRLGYGRHTLEIENPSGQDWIDLAGLDLGITAPVLTASSRRGHDRIVLWVQHRTNLLSPLPDEALTATSARIQIPDLRVGSWQVTWWDIAAGRSQISKTIDHRGGPLSLETPQILRHTAAWLERLE
jgi:hypothetical protein